MSEKPRSVFIVEDELTMSKLLQLKLSNIADEVQVFANGLEGLNAIKEFKPDLVILDVMLPGMQGFDVLENIKKDDSLTSTKILMLTAKAREEDLERGFELKADEYMSKPFKMNELLLRVQKLLN